MKLILSAMFASFIISPLAMAGNCGDGCEGKEKEKKEEGTVAGNCGGCEGKDKEKKEEGTVAGNCDKCDGKDKEKKEEGTVA